MRLSHLPEIENVAPAHTHTRARARVHARTLWIGLNCFKTAEPLQGDSLLLTTKSLGDLETHLSHIGSMKKLR